MNIEKGIELTPPNFFVPWDMSWNSFKELESENGNVNCDSSGLSVSVGSCSFGDDLEFVLHLSFSKGGDKPISSAKLNYRQHGADLKVVFDSWQRWLTSEFGEAKQIDSGLPPFQGKKAFPSYGWNIGRVKIKHVVGGKNDPVGWIEFIKK